MKTTLTLLVMLFFSLGILFIQQNSKNNPTVLSATVEDKYWLLLHRKSNQEFLYHGVSGNLNQSSLIKSFKVKTGIPGEKPTPLPKLLGREYWIITDKVDSSENLETSPYFLTLDIPVTEEEPYGPENYPECEGGCNWEIPGAFGLHGVNGDLSRLEGDGSSGCIRHTDEDITYLYNILDPQKNEVRYYIEEI